MFGRFDFSPLEWGFWPLCAALDGRFLGFFFASFFAMLIVILSRDKGLELLEHESGIVQSPLKFEARPRFKTVFEITFDENGNQYIQ